MKNLNVQTTDRLRKIETMHWDIESFSQLIGGFYGIEELPLPKKNVKYTNDEGITVKNEEERKKR